MNFIYHNTVKLFHGENKLYEIVMEIKSFGDKVLLITGGESFKKNGHYSLLESALREMKIEVYEISDNKSPSLKTVREAIKLVKQENICSIVGIGGGTCMDIAKTIAFGVKQEGDVWEYLTYQRNPDINEHLPVGTIVTLPSSGSDMNGSTQITNDETGEQAGLSEVYPNFTWHNPKFMMSIKNELLIKAQITSFVQLSLQFIDLGESDISENITTALINTLFTNLDKCLNDNEDMTAKSNLMTISALSVNGLTSLGKIGDWALYPINACLQNYCNVDYKTAIITIFPYWLKLIYNGQIEINNYFDKVFKIEIENKTNDEILNEGLNEIFNIYKKYDISLSLSEVKPIEQDASNLYEMVKSLGDVESIYRKISYNDIVNLIEETINGIL